MWQEVDDHLTRRLWIDEEWSVRGPESLTWWPWFLAQSINVIGSGSFTDDDSDNFLTVSAETRVAESDEEVGLALCQEANRVFPLGAFVWEDGVIRVVTNLALNPLCRGLLHLFHEACLAQATVAHELALEWQHLDGVTVLPSAHPNSGMREDPDELLQIFAGGERSDGTVPDDLVDALGLARTLYVRTLLDRGLTAGFSDEEVDFFNGPGVEVAVGRMDDSVAAAKYGLGLIVMTRVTEPGEVPPPEHVNDFNVAFASSPVTSLFGNVRAYPNDPVNGSQFFAYLPGGFLAESRYDISALAITVVNAVWHCTGAVRYFWSEVERLGSAGDGAEA